VTGEVRDLGRVSARADEVRDRRVPEVVERDLLNPLGLRPSESAALSSPRTETLRKYMGAPVSVVKTKS
jgi:hypothetical protein